jgi:hypothetical protein
MLDGCVCRDRDCPDVKHSADQMRDRHEGDPALPRTVQSAACRSLFDSKPVKCSCVLSVDCGPAVSAIVDISGDAGSARGRNQERDEADQSRQEDEQGHP